MKKKILSVVLSVALAIGAFQIGALIEPAVTVYAAENFVSVTPAKIANADSFMDGLMDNPASMNNGTISHSAGTNEATKTYFTFTMPERGIVKARYSIKDDTANDGDHLNSNWTIYMDKALTNAVSSTKEVNDDYGDISLELKKGTYYVECVGTWSSWGDKKAAPINTVGISVAYIPIASSAANFTTTLSKTSTTSDDIVVTVKTEDPDAGIYMLPGVQNDILVDNEFNWVGDTKLGGNTFTVKENGTYTVRIVNFAGKCFQKVITISNIDKKRPTTPTISALKVGATVISGKADAGTKVTIKIGSKSYSGVARDNGVYSIKVAKLTKGTSMKASAQDYAGNTSDGASAKVK